jgi:PhnB protein
MTAVVKAIPEGYHSVTPYLIFSGAGDAIAFYKKALGAEEVMRMDDPGGKVHHAEIKIGDSRIMLADEHPELQALSPKTIGGSPVSIHLYVEDVDAAVGRAVAAGQSSFDRWPINFTAIASAGSRTRSGIAGSSPRTRKI